MKEQIQMCKNTASGITKIAVKGFKSIAEEREIEIRPLTILAGTNSSGKSSIMQPLLMLKQTLEATYDPGPLLIDGPNVRFTSTTQFISRICNQKPLDSFQVKIETCESDYANSMLLVFKKTTEVIEIEKMICIEGTQTDNDTLPEHLTLSPDLTTAELNTIMDQHKIPKEFDRLSRSRCFLVFRNKKGNGYYTKTPTIESSLLNTIHLGGLRGNPERMYRLTSTGNKYPGRFEHYTASVIHNWQVTKNECFSSLVDALIENRITSRIFTRKTGDIGIEVQVGRLMHAEVDDTDRVNIADVGLGVSQILPVIVALIAAEPGQLVYLEQPELHLHPNAQIALAQVLADAAKRGVRVVAETHSSLLLLGVQILVAEGQLAPELVKLHWFSRNKEGITEVDSVDIDEAGRYGEWSVDFDKVDMTAEDRYLTALDKLRFGKDKRSE